MYAVTRKLKALKPIFRAQRQRKGDLSTNVALAKGFLESAQTMLTADRHCPTLLHLEFCCKLVAKRRASKRVFQINTTDGRTLTDQPEVIGEFIRYYEELLGGTTRDRWIDLRYLRPWARHILTVEEAEALTAPVSSTEIRQAIFDIDETKAPGPDGYSAGFFKAAWSVIGEEVTQALLDFFRTGRLLKQINATLISLIPKVNSPSVVAEFRPISCCNVLYKAVTKILVQRMRSILHTLISPSQNAFVPGRSIGDNVLLALVYNQRNLPPRCALKVDLRKAYDTVEWDFLKAALTLFGFPERFIQWIVECVTTTSYSVCINGAPHGFFRGARGLRQGDPMSPFLFVLVMEVLTLMLRQRIEQNGGFSYHWRCEAVQLFQLSFADDLLLFSKAEPNSIQLFKDGLIDFAELSGLQANLQKSHLILSRSAAAYRDSLLAILDFQEGHLPLRYLGLPLLASRLTISDCQPILRKMEARIKGWEGVMLSFAGRVQLIKSVLSALQVYWAMAFFAKAHYKGDREKTAQFPLERKLRHRESSVWTIRTRTGTWGWRKLIRLRDALRPHVHYQIGDGTSFSLWHDPWHPRGPLLPQFPLGPRHTALPPTAPLSAVISEDTWSWPHITDMESIDITHDLPAIHGGRDRIQWTGPRVPFLQPLLMIYSGHRVPQDVYLPLTSLGCNIWAPCVSYARMGYRNHMSIYSLCVPLPERNSRIFQHSSRPTEEIVRMVVSETRDLIICKQLPRTPLSLILKWPTPSTLGQGPSTYDLKLPRPNRNEGLKNVSLIILHRASPFEVLLLPWTFPPPGLADNTIGPNVQTPIPRNLPNPKQDILLQTRLKICTNNSKPNLL
ncbi:UNVERIFIED_CONTAM: Retrovirus-related Pol polyprotein from type-2 retrotransposable element R2DM [Sesamum radiatum]|uniref:Retrovirus-related Pol polyprotein from type-2 retrotransposable element R2DM n=1 Tax=Sesamum radiatum TaxID=300843 RepID=A0AAW2JHH4_SESRA